jgi:hypothetical protein
LFVFFRVFVAGGWGEGEGVGGGWGWVILINNKKLWDIREIMGGN